MTWYEWTAVIAQGLIFFVATIMYLLKFSKQKRAVKVANHTLHDFNKTGDIQATVNAVHQVMPRDEKLTIAQQWSRYHDRYIHKSENDFIKADPYLSKDSLLNQYESGSWYDALPGLFISLGVLLTFINLVNGLTHIHHADVETMKNNIFGLLSGMQSAFWTSIAGIATSLGFTVVESVCNSSFKKHIDIFSSKVLFLLNPDEEEVFLQRLEKHAAHQAEHLKTILVDALGNVMKPINGTLEVQNNKLETLVGVLNQFAGEISTGIVDQIAGNSKQLVADLENIVKTAIDTQKQTSDWLHQMISESQDAQQKMISTLTDVSTRYETSQEQWTSLMTDFRTSTTELQEIYTKINETAEIVKSQSSILPSLLQQEENLANRISAQATSIDEQIHVMKEHWANTGESLQTISSGLSDSMQNFSSEIDQGLAKTYERFDETLSMALKEMHNLLGQIIDTQQQVINHFEVIPDEISTGFENMVKAYEEGFARILEVQNVEAV